MVMLCEGIDVDDVRVNPTMACNRNSAASGRQSHVLQAFKIVCTRIDETVEDPGEYIEQLIAGPSRFIVGCVEAGGNGM